MQLDFTFPVDSAARVADEAPVVQMGRKNRSARATTFSEEKTMATPSNDKLGPTFALEESGGDSGKISVERGLGRLNSVKAFKRADSDSDLSPSGSGTVRSEKKQKKKKLIRYGFSLKAREYIAVGFYDQAIVLSQKANDIIGWSVALMLSNDPEKAVDIIEAFIISACLVTYQETSKGIGGVKFDYKQILASIIAAPGAPATVDIMHNLPPPNETQYRETILEVCEAASWEELHQWYLVAVLLHSGYTPPSNPWLRHFFALFAGHERNKKNAGKHSNKAVLPQTKQLDRTDVENILIAQCTGREIQLVNAIVAWQQGRYRTAMRSATEFLKTEGSDIQMRFIRGCCALIVGDRQIVGEDTTHLMQSASLFISTVGCALATFGIPLKSAREPVEKFRSSDEEQHFIYALCSWAQSLTLLQMGSFADSMKIAKNALALAPRRNLQEMLYDLIVTACVGLEDSGELLAIADKLTPKQQLYLVLVPCFGGGYHNDSINQIAIESDVGELLNPMNITNYSDVRQMIAIHCTTARSLFSFGHHREAWVEVLSAVACAEEIIGSAVYAMSDCAPHRVLFLGCTIGMTLLDRLIEEDEEAAKTLTSEELQKLREVNDKLGDEIIAVCREWSRLIRDFHPKQVLGHAAMTQVSIASYDLDSMERAVAMSTQFPDQIMTQNALSFALYSKHLIPDAIAQAQKTLQRFPHVHEVETMMYAVSGKEGTYTFLYRGFFPFTYGPGETDNTTARLWIAFFITVANCLILVGTLLCNFVGTIPYPSFIETTVQRLQVTSFIPFYVAGATFLYSMIVTFLQPTLVSVMLTDLHVRNTRINRFLFSCRGIGLYNIANAIQISVLGTDFLFSTFWYDVLLYGLLFLLQFPFSSRTFFVRSIDEPRMRLPFWITLTIADFIFFLVTAPLHVFTVSVEPFMGLVFLLYLPELPPTYNTGDVIERLEIHADSLQKNAPSRFSLTSGSNFLHIRLMKFLFFETHSNMETVFLASQQQEEDDKRVFPLVEILDAIDTAPLPLPQHYVPLDPEFQTVLDQHRKRKSVDVVGEAKLGEGNLAGLVDETKRVESSTAQNDDHLFERSILDDDELGDLTFSDKGDFGAEIMDALNAEFAKLSTQNDKLKAAAAAQSTDVKVHAQAGGKRLGDTGLYRENKERTDMLTTGPMMRQMHAKNRRDGLDEATGLPPPIASNAAGSFAAAAGALKRKSIVPRDFGSNANLQSTSTAPNSSSMKFASGRTAESNASQLFKNGATRKQSLFRRPVEFNIEDDCGDDDGPSSPSKTSTASPLKSEASGGRGLFGTTRASFGNAVDADDSSLSGSSDDEKAKTTEVPKKAEIAAAPKEPIAAKAASHSPPAVSDKKPSLPAPVAAPPPTKAPESDKKPSAAVPPPPPKAQVKIVKDFDEMSFSSDDSVSLSPSPRGNAVAVQKPQPKEESPPIPAAFSDPAAAFAVQLARKQSALLQQQRAQSSSISPASSVTPSQEVPAAKRRQSVKDMVATTVTPTPAASSGASTQPKPTTLQRRQSVAFKETNDIASADVAARPGTNPPPQVSELKRQTSAPSSQQEVSALESEDEIKAVNGNLKVRKLLDDLRAVRSNVANTFTSGTVASMDPTTVGYLKRQVEQAKLKFVQDLKKIGTKVSVDAFEAKKQISELFVELVKEGDDNKENDTVVQALLSTISTVDFGQIILSKGLVQHSLENGNAKQVEILLGYKPILTALTCDQMESFISMCGTLQDRRCSMLLSLLNISLRSRVCQTSNDRLEPAWMEALEKVLSLQQAMPNEDRSALVPLLDLAFEHPFIKFNCSRDGPDKQTIFSRACREGDIATVKYFVSKKRVRDVNRVQMDGTNALQQAAARNQVEVVEYLCDAAAAVNIRLSAIQQLPGKGTVLDIAKSLKRDARIIDALQRLIASGETHDAALSPGGATASGVLSLGRLGKPQATGTAPPAPTKKGEDCSSALKVLLAPLKSMNEEVESAQKGNTSREELGRLSDAQGLLKENIAQKIDRLPLGEDPSIESQEVRELVVGIIDLMVREGDRRYGNARLLQTLIARLDGAVNFAANLLSKFWLYRCAEAGSVEYLKVFFATRGLKDIVKQKSGTPVREVIEAAARGRLQRIPVLLAILDAETVLQLPLYSRDVASQAWQHAITDICSQKRANVAESRSKRLELIKRILQLDYLTIDFETEHGQQDKHTIFSRACSEGDLELVQLLLRSNAIRNPNRVQSSGRCALTSAIVEQHIAVVELLTSPKMRGLINTSVQTAEGTPLEVAKRYKVDGAIIDMLSKAGAS